MPTEIELRAAIDALAGEAQFSSLDELALADQQGPDRRRVFLAIAGAVAAVLVAALLIAIHAKRDRAPSAAGPCHDPGALTVRQCAAALRIAHRHVDNRDGVIRDGWPSDVRVVAVLLHRGSVRQPNIGPACVSGKLLTIDLIGFFPNENVLPAPGDDGKVRGIIVEVDAATRRPCLIGLSTSHLTVPPGATVLFRRR